MATTRIYSLLLGIALAFGAIIARLGYLQIARGEEYRRRATDRSLRLDFLHARRGTLWARRGTEPVALAEDRPSHDLAVVLLRFDPAYLLVAKMMATAGFEDRRVDRRFETIEERARSKPDAEFVLCPDLDRKMLRRIRPTIRRIRHSGGDAAGVRTRERSRDGEPIYDVIISGAFATMAERTIAALEETVETVPGDTVERAREWTREAIACPDPYQRLHDLRSPRVLVRGISFEEALWTEERHTALHGIVVVEGVRRAYPAGESTAHLVGYLGPVSSDEADTLEAEGMLVDRWRDLREIDTIRERRDGAHFKDDRIGRDGVERTFEKELRGMVGAELVERDVAGRCVREIARLAPRRGEDIQLTIDTGLQEVAATALAEAVEEHAPATGGAVVALDVKSGAVLALVSYPSFDPETFRRKYETLLSDPRRPLFHRAVHGTYPPGSVFKIVSAVAALETGVLQPGETVRCTGSFRPGSPWFKCHKRSGHGPVDVREALQRSCNVFFYEMGERLGHERLREWGRRLGVGEVTGIEIPRERAGVLPSPEWLRRISEGKTPWTRGLDRNFAIGQGDIQLTPLQVCRLVAAVAGDGVPPVPHLRSDAPGASGSFERPSARSLATVREGLRRVVQVRGGTANDDGLQAVRAAGKTGTAQAGPGRNHAWFAGFAPSEDPRVAVAVIVEKVADGAHGGSVAGPVAAAVFAKALEEPSGP